MARTKNREANATITALSHEGRGIAHIDGKATFIRFALPQEEVQFTYTRRKGAFDEGVATAIANPAAERVTPPCPHFTVCGGCSLQHLAPAQQITLKQNTLRELLDHQAHTTPRQWLAPITASTLGYRHKARLSCKSVEKKGKVLVGFREINGRYVADIKQCPILHPSIGEKIEALSALLGSLSIKAAVPQIEVAVGQEQSAIILRHLSPLTAEDESCLIEFAKSHTISIHLQPSNAASIHPLYPSSPDPLFYDIGEQGLRLEFAPQHFTQVNVEINQHMLKQALALLELTPQDRVIDLFCGIGNFTLPLATQCAQVTGVEADHAALAQAEVNANNNNLNNVEFHYADLFKSDYNTAWSERHYDKVLLDPPRAGAKEILPQVVQWKPQRIVYVSCNPATLARDASYLTQHGYTLDQAGIMDMFPHTQHVESMALFIRQE